MSRKNRILYLVSRENIAAPGVMKSQVLELLGEIVKSNSELEVTILNFPSLTNFLSNFKRIKRVKDLCQRVGIKLIIFPIVPIGRSFMPVWAIPFFLIQTIPITLFVALRHKIDIVHARSYLATLIGYWIKKILRVSLIFDTRSLYLKEAETVGAWGKSDSNYIFWEKVERSLFSIADRIVVLASEKEKYIKDRVLKANVVLIPSPVNAGSFKISATQRNNGRKKLGFTGKFVFGYSGSLGGLHDPDFLTNFYSVIRKYISKPHFLVATQSNTGRLAKALQDHKIGKEEVTILQNPVLGKTIPLANVGIHIYPNVSIAPYASSVKLPEYCAAGIPVILTSNMVSMAQLVSKENIGIVVDFIDKEDIRVKMRKLVNGHEAMGRNALKLAKNYFSVKVCARKYLKIYDELHKKNNS